MQSQSSQDKAKSINSLQKKDQREKKIEGGSNEETTLVIKQRKPDNKWIVISRGNEDNDLALVQQEAFVGQLFQFMTPDGTTPKIRSLKEKYDDYYGSMSKLFGSYSSFRRTKHSVTTDMEKDQVAAILVASYVLEEDDLHVGNYGKDETTGNFVKIDYDRALHSITCNLQGQDPSEPTCDYFSRVAPKAYKNREAFVKVFNKGTLAPNQQFAITKRDIEGFPVLNDAVPLNWQVEHLNYLAKDPVFIKAKYKYFLAFLLEANNIEMITNGFDTPRKDENIAHIKERAIELSEILLTIQEFTKLLDDPSVIDDLKTLVNNHNIRMHLSKPGRTPIDPSCVSQLVSNLQAQRTLQISKQEQQQTTSRNLSP